MRVDSGVYSGWEVPVFYDSLLAKLIVHAPDRATACARLSQALRDAVLHLETVLHTGVYRAREDVGGVVHGHPPHATALGATATELELLTHDGILFADGVGRFDQPDLIVDDDQGDRVAAALGQRRAVLMENHGVLAVGQDVPWAVLTAVTLERSAKLQSIASTLESVGCTLS